MVVRPVQEPMTLDYPMLLETPLPSLTMRPTSVRLVLQVKTTGSETKHETLNRSLGGNGCSDRRCRVYPKHE